MGSMSVQEAIQGGVPDSAVVEQILQGDTYLFEVIMRRYNQRLFRVAMSVLDDQDEAIDVVQDAYVRAYEHLGQFEGRARFSTWLTKIAVYEAKTRARRLRRWIPGDIDSLDAAEPIFNSMLGNEPANNTHHLELRALLIKVVSELPTEYRMVLILRDVEGLDTAETAECLDLTEENVKIRLFRAHSKLRQFIQLDARVVLDEFLGFGGAQCDGLVMAVMPVIEVGTSDSPLDRLLNWFSALKNSLFVGKR
ncbi:RNA polymerase sigma factor [Marinobacterium jannaschii]|uniref:RNA polymerase sigma factor n=1 Tax=Marinobacterium jannaschii TaxID=64970 RepID=UPI0006864F2A|nr:RNA polymerase sigma factor [Marinobacterium jannaschii]